MNTKKDAWTSLDHVGKHSVCSPTIPCSRLIRQSSFTSLLPTDWLFPKFVLFPPLSHYTDTPHISGCRSAASFSSRTHVYTSRTILDRFVIIFSLFLFPCDYIFFLCFHNVRIGYHTTPAYRSSWSHHHAEKVWWAIDSRESAKLV